MSDILRILIPIAAAHIVVLVIIVFVIKRLLLNDTMQAVNRIRDVEADVRKKEENIRKEIAEHEQEFERKRAENEEALRQQKEEMEKEVGREREQITAEARKEGERIIEQARQNEQKLREQVARDVESKAVDYAGEVFKLVFSEKINDEVNRLFTDELLDALQEVDAGSITVDKDDVSFTAARTIGPEQKERLKSLLREKFGIETEIEEAVDDALLAGVVFKLGSLEIDGSLRNRYAEAAEAIKKEIKI